MERIKKEMRLFGSLFGIQLAGWMMLTLWDILEEYTGIDLQNIWTWGYTIAVMILYFIFRGKLSSGKRRPTWKKIGLLFVAWLALSLLFGYPIGYMVNYGIWIVDWLPKKPYVGGSFLSGFLDGAEYWVFGAVLCVLPMLVIPVLEVPIRLFKKDKK